MPTLVAALTLAASLRMAHVSMPRWHLAFWFAVLVSLALNGSVSQRHLAANGAASFLVAWLYFALLDRTDNVVDRGLHYLVLLLGSRLWLDLHHYGIGL